MLHRLEFHAMGSEMLAVVEQEPCRFPGELAEVPGWFEEWEQVLSRFRPDSELSRLNARSGQPVAVSRTLWEVFQAAKSAESETDGLVTPTVMNALVGAGYDRSFELLHSAKQVPFESVVDEHDLFAQLVFDEPTRTIYVPDGLQLDLGGVAKGWAAQQAVARLKSNGPALVDAGGDIAVSGLRMDGSPWPIGVAEPFNREVEFAVLHIPSGGVATSGKDRRRWRQGDILQHHIIDPRSGTPAGTDVLTATVVAPSVMRAEAAAKTVFILGSRDGLSWLEADPSLAGLVVLDDGQVICSQRLQRYL